ncbi:MAG: hypothetical protein ACRD0P_23335 [Stackebrandtia sp.]
MSANSIPIATLYDWRTRHAGLISPTPPGSTGGSPDRDLTVFGRAVSGGPGGLLGHSR